MTDPARLIDAYLDGKLSIEAMDQLERDLVSNPKYADHFAKAMMVDALLKDRYERESIASSMQLADGSFLEGDDLSVLMDDYNHAQAELVHVDGKAKHRAPQAVKTKQAIDWGPALRYVVGHGTSRLIRSKVGIVGALAAVLLLSLWLINPLGGPEQDDDSLVIDVPEAVTPGPNQAVVATLTATHNAAWSTPNGPAALAAGANLSSGSRLTLTAGSAEITTARGAIAILQAPATIQLLNNNALYLHDGRLVGLCYTDTSKGFVVKTDFAQVTDLGTAFGVEVVGQDFTATVLTGKVQVAAPGNQPSLLTHEQTATVSADSGYELVVKDALAQGFDQLLPRVAQAHALRNDPAMIAYWGFEAEDIVDGKLLNRASATAGKMNGILGQTGKPDSAPTLTKGRLPGTGALRFEANEFDLIRVSAQDAKAIDGLEQFTIGLWVRPDDMDQISHHLVTKRKPVVHNGLNLGLSWDGTGDKGYAPNTVFFEGRMSQSKDAEAGSIQRRPAWTHLVVTYDRGERSIYLDGALHQRLPRADAGRLAALDAELLIGAAAPHQSATNTYLDGDLDELFILGRVMPAGEIKTLYETGVAQP